MALSDKAKDGRLIIIDSIKFEQPKTKEFVSVMTIFHDKVKNLGKKQLFITPKKDESLVRVSRNVPQVNPVLATSLNVTDVLNADSLMMMKDSLPIIEKTYLKATIKK
jgi:large subunit ribosomal protein L4